MIELKTYNRDMQSDIETFIEKCFSDLGWGYDPGGRHSDIVNIPEFYMKSGCMWCLFEENKLIGVIAVHTIDEEQKIAEMKRLYVLREYQGNGYGRLLFEKALSYCKEKQYNKINLDSQNDRDASLHLIRKYGFKEIPKYHENYFAELFFELKLN